MDLRLQDNLQGKQQDYIAPFLWLHDEDDELIIRELQKIYDCGMIKHILPGMPTVFLKKNIKTSVFGALHNAMWMYQAR